MTTARESSSEVPEFGMGDRIRAARRWQGRRITQEQIAQAITHAGLPTSKQSVGNWESGANDIEQHNRELVAVAVALRTGVDRNWILTGIYGLTGHGHGVKIGYKSRRTHRPYIVPPAGVGSIRQPLAA